VLPLNLLLLLSSLLFSSSSSPPLSHLVAIRLAINPLVPAAFCAGFFFLPETKAYRRRKQAETGHFSESRGLVSRSASVNGFDSEHPRRSVFGSFSSHKKETGIFRAHMIVSPLVAWHEVHDMWHELKDIVVHTLSRSTSYARWAFCPSGCVLTKLSVVLLMVLLLGMRQAAEGM